MPGFDKNRFIDLDQSLSQLLVCSICLNIFDEAIICDCGHTFCKSCVEQILTNTCPECRQSMSSRLQLSEQRGLVVVNGYLFVRNIRINAIISELRIKCDFELNGCEEVIELGLLSDHLKICDYRNCNDCGFTAGNSDQHNCLQLMTNDRNEWKQKYEESEQMFERFIHPLPSGRRALSEFIRLASLSPIVPRRMSAHSSSSSEEST